MRGDMNKFGSDLNMVTDAHNNLRKAGAAEQFWAGLARSDELAKLAHDLVMSYLKFTAPRPTFPLVAVYNHSFEHKLQAARCHVSPDMLTKYTFPDEADHGTHLEIELFNFFGMATRKGMLEKLDELGYRPISLSEALTLLSHFPDEIWDLCKQWTRHTADGTQEKELLILGDRMEGLVPKVPVIYLADEGFDERWWFGVTWNSRDYSCYSQGYFIPAIKKS
jgi:hypothetical protein